MMNRRNFLRGLLAGVGTAAVAIAGFVPLLRKSRAEPLPDGTYWAIVHPHQAAILKGEIGRYEGGVRFIESEHLEPMGGDHG